MSDPTTTAWRAFESVDRRLAAALDLVAELAQEDRASLRESVRDRGVAAVLELRMAEIEARK